MEFDAFLAQLKAHDLPKSPLARVRLLAKELALGAYEGLWSLEIYAFRAQVGDRDVLYYLTERWQDDHPSFGLLTVMGYLKWNDSNSYIITKAAFDLLDGAEPANIFISYRRRDSSAFALLVLARLKQAGLAPFLDMSLVAGEDWQQGLRQRLQSYDYVVLLIGPDTLASGEVIREIEWAIDAKVQVIPIWHGGFVYQPGMFDLPAAVAHLLQTTHTIRVLEESAVGYNNAVVELLNRFGVTP